MATNKVAIRLSVEAENVDAVKAKLEALGVKIKQVGDDTSADKLKRQFESLERSLDPVTAATQRLQKQKETLRKAVDELGVSEEKAAELQAKAEAQHKRVADAAERAAGSTKLAAHEVTNLGYQIQDAAVQLAGGQNPFLIMMQQGPQAAGAVGGFGRAMALLATPTAAAVAGVGLLAGGFGVILQRSLSIQDNLRQFNALLRATGNEAGVTAQQLRNVANSMVQQGASRDDANAVAASIVRARKLVGEQVAQDIGSLSVDMGTVFGGTAEAGQKLTQWLSNGIPGLRDMAKETGALSLAQYEAARAALEHGNKAQALGIVIGALKERFSGLHKDSISPAAEAMKAFGNAYDDLVEKVASTPLVLTVTFALTDQMKTLAGLLNAPSAETLRAFLGSSLTYGMTGANPVAPGGASPGGAQAAPAPAPGVSLAAYPAAPGAPIPGAKPAPSDGLSGDEARHLSDLRDANDRLAKAMSLVGAQRQIAVAQAQAEISALEAGRGATAALKEGQEAARMARVQLNAAIAETTAQLSLSAQYTLVAADAYLKGGDAAGKYAEAVKAAKAEELSTGVPAEQRARQLMAEQAAQTALSGAQQVPGLEREAAARQKVADAALRGVAAQSQAELASRIEQATLQERLALANANAETEATLTDVIQRKTKAIQDEDAAQKRLSLNSYTNQQGDALTLARAELALAGRNADERARILGHLKSELDLRRQFPGIADDELRRLVAQNDELLVLQQTTAKQQALWDELGNSLGRAFDRLGDSLSQVFTEGSAKAVKWGDITKAIIASLMTDLFKMAAINPLRNAMFGGSAPSLWSAFGGLPATSSNTYGMDAQGGTMGAASQAVQFGQSAYSAMTGSTASTMANAGTWFAESSVGNSLGLSTAYPIMTGGGGAPVTQVGTAYAANGSGQALSGVMGNLGYAAPYGFLGGMGGAYLGNNVFGGSKLAGGLSGAVLGVGSMAAGTAAMGAMGMGAAASAAGVSGMAGATAALSAIPVYGWIAAAALAAVTAIFGTQKPSVGPTAGAVIERQGDGSFKRTRSAADNGANTDYVNQVSDAVSQSLNMLVAAGAKTSPDASWTYLWGGDKVRVNGKAPQTPDQFVKEVLGAFFADGLVGRALDTAKGQDTVDLEGLLKATALARNVEDSTTALQSFDKSLDGVRVRAKQAQADALKPMAEELALAAKYGFSGEYTALVTSQMQSTLEDIRSPQTWTATEQAVAQLTGQLQAMREAAEKVSPTLAGTVDAVKAAALTNMRVGLYQQNDASIFQAQGRDYLNTIRNLVSSRDGRARDLAAVGGNTFRADVELDAWLRNTMKDLTAAQLDDITSFYGDSIGVLAQSMKAANITAKEAADAQNELAKAQQQAADSLRGYLDKLGLSDLSSLSAPEQFTLAQSQFGSALGGSDVSAATAAADALLRAGRSMYGTTADYSALSGWTTSSLKSFGARLGLPGFANGTDYAPSGWALVGESGPEIIRFRGGEKVTPRAGLTANGDDVKRQNALLAEQNDLLRALLDATAQGAEHVAGTVLDVGERQARAAERVANAALVKGAA